MEIKNFIANVAEQFDDIDETALVPDTNFREVEGYTSLTALMIITMIDEEYNIVISGDDMQRVKTLKELFDLVKSRL